MTTILGAGGPIGTELATILAAKNLPFRLVSRNPKPMLSGQTFAADLSSRDQVIRAVAGSRTVHLVAGLKYDLTTWRELWPRIMANVIEACKQAGARLIFFDNVYMYGRVAGPMTEQTPYHPTSKKGEIRARIALELEREMKTGGLTAQIARAADFYGPDTKNGVPNLLVFEPFTKGATASWLVDAEQPHSLTLTTDAARGIAMLAESESAWNQIWHLPTAAKPLTGRQFIEAAADAMGVAPKHRVLNRPMLWIAGLFNPTIRESFEMLYQNDSPYLFDSTKFARAFGFEGTPYPEGIRLVAESYRRKPA